LQTNKQEKEDFPKIKKEVINMVFKPKKKETEEYAEEDENPEEDNIDESSKEDHRTFSKQEIRDAIEGHLNRAADLIRYI
jgi:hypothetical protein